MKIYDGYTNNNAVIGTFCGKLNGKLDIYSTGEALHIEFLTKSGRPPVKNKYVSFLESESESKSKTQRKGFKAEFEIGGDFVDLCKYRQIRQTLLQFP